MRSILAAVCMVAGCEGPASLPPAEFDGNASLRYVETQLGFGPRIPGSEGHRRMAVWLDSLLRTRADSLEVQRWTHVTRAGMALPLVNYLARFNPGASARLLFLAHWDTRPKADAPASRDTTLPVPGANDGASGVAVLLAMADALKKAPPGIGVDLLFVDGEDYGSFDEGKDQDVLLGSRYYAAHLPSGAPPRFAVLFDMIGDKDLRIQREGSSVTGAPDVVDAVWELAGRLGYRQVFVDEEGIPITDDHTALQQAGIRAIDLIDFDYGPGNKWHHSPDDTIDKVSAASLKAVGDVGMGLVRGAKPA
ncbi:MAG TPA: M28 family peptidase [Gemmatimonadales bacterium]|nr:M28 family peptidase [Gemmatimonadales bacterium]